MTTPDYRVEIDFPGADPDALVLGQGRLDTAELGAEFAFLDVTELVRSGSIARGATSTTGPYLRANAGTASVALSNDEGAFDPLNPDGPYVAEGVTLVRPRRRWRIRGPEIEEGSAVRLSGNGYVYGPDAAAYTGLSALTVDLLLDLSGTGPSGYPIVSKHGSWRIDYFGPSASTPGWVALVATDTGGTVYNRTAYCVLPRSGLWWLRFRMTVASGDFIVERSPDGSTWTEIGRADGLAMAANYRDSAAPVVVGAYTSGESLSNVTPAAHFVVHEVVTPAGSVDFTSMGRVQRTVEGTSSAGVWTLAGDATVEGGDGRPVLWSGYVEAWRNTYPAGGHDAVATLAGVDGRGLLARDIGPADESVLDEGTGERVAELLEHFDWPDGARLDAGLTILPPGDYPTTAWTAIQLVTDTEAGELWVDGEGRLVFHQRHAAITNLRRSVSRLTFGDDPDEATEVPYRPLVVVYDDSNQVTRARIARAGGTVQTAEDAAAIALDGVVAFERTDLLMGTDQEAEDHAAYLVATRGNPGPRIDRLTVDLGHPRLTAEQVGAVLALELGDRVTVKHRPPGLDPDAPWITEQFVRGIKHTWSESSTLWTVELTLEGAAGYDFLVLDSAELGVLDEDRLAPPVPGPAYVIA